MKNNRNPETVVYEAALPSPPCLPLIENIQADLCVSFDTAMAEHPRFFYNEITFLLALTFVDEALVSIGLLSELWDLDFPPNTDKIPLL